MDDQIGPVWFVFSFHTLVHILGIFTMVLLPSSWRLGVASQYVALPAFRLVVWVSALSLVWALLRIVALRTCRIPILILLLIPVVVSAGTLVYAVTVTKCTVVGRRMIEAELGHLNKRIERFSAQGRRMGWELRERDRLIEELK